MFTLLRIHFLLNAFCHHQRMVLSASTPFFTPFHQRMPSNSLLVHLLKFSAFQTSQSSFKPSASPSTTGSFSNALSLSRAHFSMPVHAISSLSNLSRTKWLVTSTTARSRCRCLSGGALSAPARRRAKS